MEGIQLSEKHKKNALLFKKAFKIFKNRLRPV
jgi:hypothetical protein